jgi:TolB-like protein
LDFESIGSEEFLGKGVSEIMRTELVGTKKFRVVERSQMQKALEEQKLHLTGVIDDKTAVEVGKLVGADFIVVGSVVKIGSSYTINSRMIDVKTGEAKLGRNVTGNNIDLLTNMSRELIEGLFGAGPSKPKASLPKEDREKPRAILESKITWDFETGDLRGWTSTGQAFAFQPTYQDNPTARRRGQPSQHQGDYWIGGYEKRPRPHDPPGQIQGDGPQGTLLSEPFVIRHPGIQFLIGGGCDITKVRVELVVDGRVVRSSTGACHESMHTDSWDVSRFIGNTARIRLIDHSSGGWGHINFDDVRFLVLDKEAKPCASTAQAPLDVANGQTEITWDFETGDLRGWSRAGQAFAFQPTYQDNPTARRRGQPSRHQGDYWIGGYEKRPGPYDPPGQTQGDGPQGTLLSKPFIISKPFVSFLIGGGCDIARVRVELIVGSRVIHSATGKCNESMSRQSWDVSQHIGKSARIRLVDHSSGGWGHINFDDVRFGRN